MKLHIVVEVRRVEGPNHPAAAVAEHVCKRIIPEATVDPGNIWVDDTQYKIIKAEAL